VDYGFGRKVQSRALLIRVGLCYIVGMADPQIELDIAERNALRASVGLPLLDNREVKRLMAVRDEAAFEAFFAQQRVRFSHHWTNNDDGWLVNMGRVSLARRKVREEWLRGDYSDAVAEPGQTGGLDIGS
jgi:hypothetical protein